MSTAVVSFLPAYDQYFPANGGSAPTDWSSFINGTKEEIQASLSERAVDFSVQDRRTWLDVAKSIAQWILITAVFSYGVYRFGSPFIQHLAPRFVVKCQNLSEMFTKPALQKVDLVAKTLFYTTVIRYILQRVMMILIYPVQSRIFTYFTPEFAKSALSLQRLELFERFRTTNIEFANVRKEDRRVVFRDVVLEKNGVRYSGILFGCAKFINNGHWALQTPGHVESVESSLIEAAHFYASVQYNVLMINGPNVGKSQGQATPERMGDAQQVGISFLENAVKATKLVIAGRSSGGAATGKAILQHSFTPDVHYLAIPQMTFDSVSSIAGKIISQNAFVQWFIAKLVQFLGCEMDSVAASKKLEKLGIKEVIVQSSGEIASEQLFPKQFIGDGIIPTEATLAYALVDQNIRKNKRFLGLGRVLHTTNQAIPAAKNEILEFSKLSRPT